MNMLKQLQNDFQEYLLNGDRNIHSNIVSTEKMPADKRLNIYANAYYARLAEALAATYPALRSYLGFEDFYDISCAYAKAYPSAFRSIRWFGDKFSLFFQGHLAEIAEIEWNMSAVFDSKDALPLSIDKLAKIPPESWETMQIKLHPSVRRINLNWNSIAIWQDLMQDKTPSPPIENEFTVPWIFWRKNLDNQYGSLEAEDAWALDALIRGEDFGTVCEGLLQWNTEDNLALRAASLLKGWTEAGLIGEILYQNHTT
jgi:hypothetical protein